MNKKKTIILVAIIICLLLLLVVIFYPKKTEDLVKDDVAEWDIDLMRKFSSYVEEVYPSDKNYLTSDTESIIITLQDLKENYNKDVSMFNTKRVSCDLEKSTIEILKDDDNEIRKIDLLCEKKN